MQSELLHNLVHFLLHSSCIPGSLLALYGLHSKPAPSVLCLAGQLMQPRLA